MTPRPTLATELAALDRDRRREQLTADREALRAILEHLHQIVSASEMNSPLQHATDEALNDARRLFESLGYVRDNLHRGLPR